MTQEKIDRINELARKQKSEGLTEEEKQNGAVASGAHHRKNMLSAFTYFADDSRLVREEPGDFLVRDCTVENADRLLHYNYSGNEAYQKNRPLSNIRFERITARGIRLPLNLYGHPAHPVVCTIADATLSFAADMPLMHAGYFERITLENVVVTGAAPRVRVWTDGAVEGNTAVAVEQADEPFYTDAI